MRKLMILVSLLTLAVGGCSAPNESEQYRDSISVSGFRLVRSDFEKAAYAVYVGLANSDLQTSVAGPGLVLAPPNPPRSRGTFRHVLEGVETKDDHGCSVNVFELEHGEGAAQYAGDLKASERSDVISGVRVVIKIEVLCKEQANP